jgi:beta-galactosidase
MSFAQIYGIGRSLALIALIALTAVLVWSARASAQPPSAAHRNPPRHRLLLNDDWRFKKYDSAADADALIYNIRPEVTDAQDDRAADAEPTAAVDVESSKNVLKPWILPTANRFIADPAKRHVRPPGDPGSDFPFVKSDFDDTSWQRVNLPHDWAIEGPFQRGEGGVGGGMGRLPSPGVAWYRKKIDIHASDAGRSIFLDVDGAMSYAMVWCNGHLVGGWPYGYASWRVDLTPYLHPGENQLAIRLDNPPDSSRWYPGGGIYRNVWLVTSHPIHIAKWGIFVSTRDVSQRSATVDIETMIDNDSDEAATIDLIVQIFEANDAGNPIGKPIAQNHTTKIRVPANGESKVKQTSSIANPRLWGPPPTQSPHRYAAVATVLQDSKSIDGGFTPFGIRALRFDPAQGLFVNGELIEIKGANQHHDLGALGAAFNYRAAERQLELLREMGCNAIRMAHNPPAPELLDFTDRMGFLVVDEVFDSWERRKTPLDFHLIFTDWSEPDTRAFIRRDRNHPSVILWSFGNEVGEQYTDHAGAAVAQRLHDIVRSEDPTRPTTTAMNFAKPDMPLPAVPDVISLNYQGEGIRDAPAYRGLQGITTPPIYPVFREKLPNKLILSSENAAALSSRGEYLFPVAAELSAPVADSAGGNPQTQQVSAYELYTAPFGSSADKVFASLDKHPYVAGGFAWSGWDYLGEPTPYYGARSSYFGVIDLAGFKKDRFYLYQSYWRPDLPMAHILPHWTWPDRVGEVTPVHVFTSGDEAELFLNGKSLGRKKKQPFEYRLRWDDVRYEPGELKAVAYKAGKPWAEDVVRTAGEPARLEATVDRAQIRAGGNDLAFVTVRIVDEQGQLAPRANLPIEFTIDGPGEIVATDNGDPTNLVPFPSHERAAFNGLCLAVVRGTPGEPGSIRLTAAAPALNSSTVTITTTD